MISVIVPAYNCEDSIERTVDAVLSQTYTDFEVLVINDGSTDATASRVARRYAQEKRVRLISQQNGGVSAARNRGIDEAAGEYVAFVDSDDYPDPRFLEVLRSLQEEDALAVVNFAYDDGTQPVLPSNDGFSTYEIEPTRLAEAYFVGELKTHIAFSIWNKLFSRSVLNEQAIRFENGLTMGEDMLFVYRYLCACRRVRFSGEALYHYVIHAGSAVRVSNPRIAQAYQKTFDALTALSTEQTPIAQSVIDRWAADVTTYVLANPYVLTMRCKALRAYHKELTALPLIRRAAVKTAGGGFRQRCMQWVLRTASPTLFCVFIKSTKLYMRLRNGVKL